jgi:hypothetical protein
MLAVGNAPARAAVEGGRYGEDHHLHDVQKDV